MIHDQATGHTAPKIMPMSPQARQSRWIPWSFAIGFIMIAIANGTLIYQALHTFPGLSVDDAYDHGRAYNDTIAEADRQAALGWRAQASWQPAPAAAAAGHDGVLSITMQDDQARALSGLTLIGRLTRPLGDQSDQPLRFVETSPGRYVADAHLPMPGLWETQIRASRGADRVFAISRVFVP